MRPGWKDIAFGFCHCDLADGISVGVAWTGERYIAHFNGQPIGGHATLAAAQLAAEDHARRVLRAALDELGGSANPSAISPDPRWVSAANRQPDADGRYLVARPATAAGTLAVSFAVYERGEWLSFSRDAAYSRPPSVLAVSAWMPVPAVPDADAALGELGEGDTDG